jgi:hypothetical protein
MLRIRDIRETMPDGSAVWTIKVDGNNEGDWVKELRRAWRAVELAAAGASIRLVLGDVRCGDAARAEVPTEMHRDGTGILATTPATAAFRDAATCGAPKVEPAMELGDAIRRRSGRKTPFESPIFSSLR